MTISNVQCWVSVLFACLVVTAAAPSWHPAEVDYRRVARQRPDEWLFASIIDGAIDGGTGRRAGTPSPAGFR